MAIQGLLTTPARIGKTTMAYDAPPMKPKKAPGKKSRKPKAKKAK